MAAYLVKTRCPIEGCDVITSDKNIKRHVRIKHGEAVTITA